MFGGCLGAAGLYLLSGRLLRLRSRGETGSRSLGGSCRTQNIDGRILGGYLAVSFPAVVVDGGVLFQVTAQEDGAGTARATMMPMTNNSILRVPWYPLKDAWIRQVTTVVFHLGELVLSTREVHIWWQFGPVSKYLRGQQKAQKDHRKPALDH